MSGWFSVKHGIRKHPIFKGRPERLGAWIAMLDEAAWRDTTQDVRGAEVSVKRGQICASQAMLMDWTGLTRQQLRDFLQELEGAGVISRKATKSSTGKTTKTRTMITVCNYDKYQKSSPSEKPSEQPSEQPIKEQNKQIPPSEDASASAENVVDLASPESAVWAIGKPYLSQHGETNPGGMIGRWLKTNTAGEIILAIEAAKKAKTQDPKPYISKILAGDDGRPVSADQRAQNIAKMIRARAISRVTQSMARDAVEAGCITLDECRRAGVAV